MEMELENYRITVLNIINEKKVPPSKKVKMSLSYGSRIDDNEHCSVKCSCTLRLADEDDLEDRTFYVRMDLEGTYVCSDINAMSETEKDSLSTTGAEELLPFLNAHISTAMSSVGLEPIILPVSQIKKSSALS